MDRIYTEFLRRAMALALCMALLSSQAAPVFAASGPDMDGEEDLTVMTSPAPEENTTPAPESEPSLEVSDPAEGDEAIPSPSDELVESETPDESAEPDESVQPSEEALPVEETAEPAESLALEESEKPAESEKPTETEGGYKRAGPLTDNQISLFATVGDPIDPDTWMNNLPEDYRAYYYSIGFGIPGVLQDNTYSLEDYDYFYAVEAKDSTGYGFRKYSDSPSSVALDKVTNPDAVDNSNAYPGARAIPYTTVAYSGSGSFTKSGALSFCVLPGEDILGRVPDQAFGGWYLYPLETKPENNSNTLQSPATWLFADDVSEAEMIPVITYPYNEDTSPNKDYYEYYKTHGDVWDGGFDYSDYGYTVIPNATFRAWTPDRNNPVSLVGKWVASSNSKARNLVDEDGRVTQPGVTLTVKAQNGTVKATPQLYTDVITGKSLSDLAAVEFDPEVTEYWLRVDADVAMVDLALNAYEPYYAYNVEGTGACPVTITATYGGTTTYNSAEAQGEGALSGAALPEAKLSGSNNVPQNSVTNPAYSHWTAGGISLRASDGANGNYYNDLRVTITAPDTMAQTTYVFHIQRMAEPTLKQNPGNTPFGMIRRDTAAVWGEDAATITANKDMARDFFTSNLHFGEHYTPQDSTQNNNGSIYRGTYGAGAWDAYTDKVTGKSRNIDLDETAIVVYQDSAFLDPGITMTDSQGNEVKIAESGTVMRSLKLSGTSELGLESMRDGSDQWYIGGKLYEKSANGSFKDANGNILDTSTAFEDADGTLWETLKRDGGTDQIDLRGMNVLPGIYTLEYRLNDPVSDRSYRSTASVAGTSGQTGFLDPEYTDNALTFSRTLVVLPIPGDVDMDGAVTAADAAELRRKLSITSNLYGEVVTLDGIDITSDPVAALMAYRVCDVNGDGVLNMDDLALLETIPEPQLRTAGDVTASDYLYLPLPTGETSTYRPRLTLTDESGEGKAKLSIRYLGQEKANRQTSGAYVGSEIGPWNADPNANIELGDTFWVGVYLNDSNLSDLLNQSVAAFSLSLTYDAQYLEPVTVLNSTQISEANQANSDLWEWMMRVYNLGARSQTVWGTGAYYNITEATGYGRAFTTHYSKAITSLEANQTSTTQLRELVFSLERQTGNMAVLSSGQELCLMVVPFRLKSHPFGMDGQSVRMVELGAGMSEFSFVSTGYGIGGRVRSATNVVTQPLDMASLFAATGSGNSPVAAYSMYPIFGQFTANLRDHIAYTKVGVDVPLGSDKSQAIELYNELDPNDGPAVYSTEFRATMQNQGIPIDAALSDIIDLPSWLSYTARGLTGTPTKAGTYDFYIRGIHYRIKVEKAPLHYWAERKYSYYGQTEYRGEPNSADRGNKENYNFTFRFDPADIKSIDLARAETLGITVDATNNSGPVLEAVLSDPKYNDAKPTFKAVLSSDVNRPAVSIATPVGRYDIDAVTVAIPTNYEMIYEANRSGQLEIMRRPFVVKELTTGDTPVAQIYNDNVSGRVPEPLVANLGNGKTDFAVELAKDPAMPEGSGLYNGYPLTPIPSSWAGESNGVLLDGDTLEISYNATLQKTGADTEKGFELGGKMEDTRPVAMSVIFQVGGESSNYYLADASPSNLTPTAVGLVLLRAVESIRIATVPAMEYTYGDVLMAFRLHFYIVMGSNSGKQEEGTFVWSEALCESRHLTVTWATKEQIENGEDGDIPYEASQVFDMRFNGRYLTLSIPSDKTDEQGNTVIIRQYWPEPLVVKPRTIVLTAQVGQRFYGEETGADSLNFTYNPEQLLSRDKQLLQELHNKHRLTGESSELEGLAGYVPPTMGTAESVADVKSVEDLSNESICKPLSKYTRPLSGRRYALYLSGAKSDNYVFQYTYEDAAGNKVVQDDWGASAYYVRPRLIVVESIKLPSGEDEPLDGLQIYSDTRSVTKKGDLTAAQVELSVPETDPVTGKVKYYALHGVRGESECTYADGNDAPALVNGDDLTLRYTATVLPDKTSWVSMSNGYYNMEQENGKGYQMYPVQISELELTGESVGNYTLVYKAEVASLRAQPNQTVTLRDRPVLNSPMTSNYYIPGTGTEADGQMAMAKVLLRPIVDVELINQSRLNYTYGEFYNPATLVYNRAPMQASLVYENDPDIRNDDRTSVTETVSFGPERYEDGELVTTFDVRSLTIYWVAEGQTVLQAVEAGQTLRYGQPVTEAVHNGKHVAVVSHRSDVPVCSHVSQGVLSVTSKKLKLTALSQNRAYGEENEPFAFSLDLDELAQWDQDVLTAEQKALAATDGNAVLSALAAAQGYTYTPPTLSSEAGPGSDVRDGGNGYYPIELSGGALSNYIIEDEPGELHIYPRMIRISRFISDRTRPIYSIYTNTNRRKFDTTVSNKGTAAQGEPSFEVVAPSFNSYNIGDVLVSITGGDAAALYGDDELILDIVVDFTGMTDDNISEEEKVYNVTVSSAKLAAGGKSGNYILQTQGSGSSATAVVMDRNAIGVTQRRSIKSMRIMGLPRTTDYTYGEELDLRGLVVRITYQTGQGESVADQMRMVSFLSRDQFAAQGLYVNYYDYPTVRESRPVSDGLGNVTETGNVQVIFGGASHTDAANYRPAATGDHLTVAPEHAKFRNRDFSANGKYLVISAQLEEGDPAVVPLLVPQVLNGSDPYQIKVNPLPLTFTVGAEDKTYDSNTQGAGTITFTNVFDQNGITDQIYPITGASYENNWYSLSAGHTSFREYVMERGYSFSTGAYEPAGTAPLGINAPIDWGGMLSGRRYTYSYESAQENDYLRFRFTDPNVAYRSTPTAHNYGDETNLAAMDVEVLGLRLAGPDARNYTLLGQSCDETASNVLTITAQSVAEMSSATKATYRDARGAQAASGLPQATIHKANRAALPSGDGDVFPTLELDEHTNVVRLRYDQALSKVSTRGPDEMEEGAAQGMALHFEYAVQYFDADGILCQWAGQSGLEGWWDETFFGGETDVKPQIPEGYIPKEDDIPTQEDLEKDDFVTKGQVYRWSEEDGGFVVDESAYPGGEEQLGYVLYATSRTELPRDTVFYPVVRAAETWNYNASPAMSSTGTYTPWRIQQVLDAQAALNSAFTEEEHAAAMAQMEAASAEARTALTQATDQADAAVEAERAVIEAMVEAKGNEEVLWPENQKSMAVRTYPQRLELISSKSLESADTSMRERVDVPTLEAVWFTYHTDYPMKEYMDAVARNSNPLRYRAYYWDAGHSATVDFKGETGDGVPLSLADVVRGILIKEKDEEGREVEKDVEVNLLHNDGPGHDAKLYVNTSKISGTTRPASITIQPGKLFGAVGDAPQKLEVTVTPSHANDYVVLWSSSDESVVKVDENGVVTFVGVGTAVITAKAINNCVSSIVVTVTEGRNSDYPKAIFDFDKLDEFFLLDAQGRFWPHRALTRGEAAALLFRLYKPNPAWDKTGPADFPDLTGNEYYAAAARELGSVGVFLGMPDGTFAGEQIITRAEFVTLLVRMLGIDVPSTKGLPHAYLDTGERDTWAYAHIDALSQMPGILQGVGGGYFAPGRDITRAEAATLLDRLLQYELDDSVKPMLMPTDVSDKSWAYRAILRGINQLLDV